MINHTILDAIRSYVDEQGLVGAVLMDSDVEGIAEAVDAALNPPVPEFAPETLVDVTDDNAAHALIDRLSGRWACDPPGYIVGSHIRAWERMAWAEAKGPWPCQTCVSRLNG